MPPSMTCRKLSHLAISAPLVLLAALTLCPSSFAQGSLPDAPSTNVSGVSIEPVSSFVTPAPAPETTHKFWDRENKLLFLTAAALNGADFAVTRSNLQSGGQELNPIVRVFGRSTPALALNFAGETAGFVTMSYFFHRTGHHKMEHIVSYVNIGGSAGAVTYGLMHR
jgi:hypothetical protein